MRWNTEPVPLGNVMATFFTDREFNEIAPYLKTLLDQPVTLQLPEALTFAVLNSRFDVGWGHIVSEEDIIKARQGLPDSDLKTVLWRALEVGYTGKMADIVAAL